MLLDDTEVAINDLLAACQESIGHYADAVSRVAEPGLRERLERVAEARREDVECLSGIVRAAGGLPRAPYADRSELHRIVTHVKAALADDEVRVLLEDRIEDERRVESLATEALELELAEDARACVERMARRAGEARAELAAAAGR